MIIFYISAGHCTPCRLKQFRIYLYLIFLVQKLSMTWLFEVYDMVMNRDAKILAVISFYDESRTRLIIFQATKLTNFLTRVVKICTNRCSDAVIPYSVFGLKSSAITASDRGKTRYSALTNLPHNRLFISSKIEVMVTSIVFYFFKNTT